MTDLNWGGGGGGGGGGAVITLLNFFSFLKQHKIELRPVHEKETHTTFVNCNYQVILLSVSGDLQMA